MPEPEAAARLVERIVAAARIPGRARRDEVRRELLAHFEDAGASPEEIRGALLRFGDEEIVIRSLASVYRADYVLLYLAKVTAALAASVAAALLIQLAASLRWDGAAQIWRVAAGFPRAAASSAAVVLGLVAAWEAARPPFQRSRAAASIGAYAAVWTLAGLLRPDWLRAFVSPTVLVILGCLCSRVGPRAARIPLLLATFAAALYANHLGLGIPFGPGRALLAGALLALVWSSGTLILARAHSAFEDHFHLEPR